MNEEALEKPTDNELREQIKSDWRNSDTLWLFALVVGVILIISRQIIQGLLLGISLFILMNQCRLSQKLDKIRLEIRGR